MGYKKLEIETNYIEKVLEDLSYSVKVEKIRRKTDFAPFVVEFNRNADNVNVQTKFTIKAPDYLTADKKLTLINDLMEETLMEMCNYIADRIIRVQPKGRLFIDPDVFDISYIKLKDNYSYRFLLRGCVQDAWGRRRSIQSYFK